MTAEELFDSFVVQLDPATAIYPGERRAVISILESAESYGYGNMISWLATAWAVHLAESGMPVETAIAAASNHGPYPHPKLKSSP